MSMKVPPAPFTHHVGNFYQGAFKEKFWSHRCMHQLVNICIITLICTTKTHLIRGQETNKFKRFLC